MIYHNYAIINEITNFDIHMAKFLITGGSGLIGSKLTQSLFKQGHEVAILTRRETSDSAHPREFQWNPTESFIDEQSIQWADYIIHLAGESVAASRWTSHQKEKILNSRIKTTRLIHEYLEKTEHSVRALVGASAIGYYGSKPSDHTFTEEDPPGDDFLAHVTEQWEAEVNKISGLGIRVATIRIGIVLDAEDGALPKMAGPVKFGLGSPIGSGKQIMPWIHIADLVRIFEFVIENKQLAGPYNAVAPQKINNRSFMKQLAHTLNKPFILPPVPAFMLKALLGEMSVIVLTGNDISSGKIVNSGFEFKFTELQDALTDLYSQ